MPVALTKGLNHKCCDCGIALKQNEVGGEFIGRIVDYGEHKIGGPLGAIVGTMVGDHLTKAVDKRFGKTYFESKEGKKLIELASQKSPAMAKVLKKELQKYGVKAEAMKKEMAKQEGIKKSHQEWQAKKGVEIQKQLPSPSYIPMGAKTSKDEIKVLQANKNPVSVNPKNKKFQTSYNSSGMMPKKELEKKLGGLFKGEVSQRKSKKKTK